MNRWLPKPGEVACVAMTADQAPVAPTGLLTPDELRRAGRFCRAHHAGSWVAWRAGLRYLLGKMLGCPPTAVPIATTANGKPVLTGQASRLHFNLSHCDDLAVYAFSLAGPVGVDVERRDRGSDLAECAATFCHPQELRACRDLPAHDRPEFLLDRWVAKEALLKALGSGLTQPPEELCLEWSGGRCRGHSDTPLPGLGGLRVRRIAHPALASHVAMLATQTDVHHCRVLDLRAPDDLYVAVCGRAG